MRNSLKKTKNLFPLQNYNLPFIDSRYFDAGFTSGKISTVAADASNTFYNRLFEEYATTGTMVAYENDFMDFNYLLFNEFLTNVTSYDTWMQGMSDAALNYKLPIQLCMSLPNQIMQSLLSSAVTNARASEDNFPGGAHASAWEQGSRWQIAYTSVFYAALDVMPFMDVIWTSAHCAGSPYPHDRDNIVLQVCFLLGGGIVRTCFFFFSFFFFVSHYCYLVCFSLALVGACP